MHVPAVVKHVAKVQTAAAMETLRQDVYNRRYNVMVYGLQGPAYEDEEATEALVLDWVKVNLNIDTPVYAIGRAHRLKRGEANCGIIVRFNRHGLAEKWVSAATRIGRQLKQMKVSLVQDLPPALRITRNALLAKRADAMKAGDVEKAFVRHVPTYPFVQLVVQKKVVGAGPAPPREIINPEESR